MNVEIAANGLEVAERAADRVAAALRDAIAERGQATLAVSGGRTPGDALSVLAGHALPWDHVHLFQVDERVAPDGHADRNLELIRHRFLASRPLPPAHVHAMDVADPDLHAAAEHYAARLREVAGEPPVLDVVQLGLGADGHTASLVPGDPVVDVVDRDVAPTGPYQGRRRLTLTYPALARARRLVWIVQGASKSRAVAGLLGRDVALPAARLPHDRAVLVADRDAVATVLGHPTYAEKEHHP